MQAVERPYGTGASFNSIGIIVKIKSLNKRFRNVQ